jgi:hypothetical protein
LRHQGYPLQLRQCKVLPRTFFTSFSGPRYTFNPSNSSRTPTQTLQQDWDAFRHLINERLLLKVPLKTDSDIEAAIKNFNDIIQWAGWTTTPEDTEARQAYDCHILIKQKMLNKRRLRRNWHRFRTTESKRMLNAATRELKQLLAATNNASFQTFLQSLSPSASTDYSLWKAAKKAKQATILPTHFGQHKEHGPERTLKKHEYSQTI